MSQVRASTPPTPSPSSTASILSSTGSLSFSQTKTPGTKEPRGEVLAKINLYLETLATSPIAVEEVRDNAIKQLKDFYEKNKADEKLHEVFLHFHKFDELARQLLQIQYEGRIGQRRVAILQIQLAIVKIYDKYFTSEEYTLSQLKKGQPCQDLLTAIQSEIKKMDEDFQQNSSLWSKFWQTSSNGGALVKNAIENAEKIFSLTDHIPALESNSGDWIIQPDGSFEVIAGAEIPEERAAFRF